MHQKLYERPTTSAITISNDRQLADDSATFTINNKFVDSEQLGNEASFMDDDNHDNDTSANNSWTTDDVWSSFDTP